MITMCALVSLAQQEIMACKKTQCILCSVVVSSSNLKPSKIQEHFKNKHGRADVEGHDVGSLKIKRAHFDSQGTLPKSGFVSVEKPLLHVSYHVAYKVAKSKKPHTITEDLIKPNALEMATIILAKEAKKNLNKCTYQIMSFTTRSVI